MQTASRSQPPHTVHRIFFLFLLNKNYFSYKYIARAANHPLLLITKIKKKNNFLFMLSFLLILVFIISTSKQQQQQHERSELQRIMLSTVRFFLSTYISCVFRLIFSFFLLNFSHVLFKWCILMLFCLYLFLTINTINM